MFPQRPGGGFTSECTVVAVSQNRVFRAQRDSQNSERVVRKEAFRESPNLGPGGKIFVWFRAFQHKCRRHLGPGDSLMRGTLCPLGQSAASLVSTDHMPGATPQLRQEKKMPLNIAECLPGTPSSWLPIMAIDR